MRAGEGVAVLPRYLVEGALRRRELKVLLPSVKPLSDHFRLVYRADDPRSALFEAMAATMLRAPLR